LGPWQPFLPVCEEDEEDGEKFRRVAKKKADLAEISAAAAEPLRSRHGDCKKLSVVYFWPLPIPGFYAA
jgi:hypothetical protein